MKQSTTFLTILEQLITEEDIKNILNQFDYIDIARKFTVKSLLEFFTIAAANKFKSFRHGADVAEAYKFKAFDYSTASKKASQVPFVIFKAFFQLIVSRCNHTTRRKLKFPQELLLVDSTTITVGEARLDWAKFHGKRSGVKLHIALTLSSNMPLKVVETIGSKHDGPILDELTDKEFIIVADRAYFQIDRSDQFTKDKQGFVIRLKNNIGLINKKTLKRLIPEDSNVTKDFTCEIGCEKKHSKYRYRIVEFIDYEGKMIRVATNLLNVSAEQIAEMYKARWAVELFFRWIKQNLNVPTLFGTTENSVYNQLFAALIAYVVLKHIYDCTKDFIKIKSLSLLGFTRRLFEGTLSVEWLVTICKFIEKNDKFTKYNLGING